MCMCLQQCTQACINVCMYVYIDVCMYVYMCVCMYVFMYVCKYVAETSEHGRGADRYLKWILGHAPLYLCVCVCV